jgi:hypothetical protein
MECAAIVVEQVSKKTAGKKKNFQICDSQKKMNKLSRRILVRNESEGLTFNYN